MPKYYYYHGGYMSKPKLTIKNYKSLGITKISDMDIPAEYLINVDLEFSSGVTYYLEKDEWEHGFSPGKVDWDMYQINGDVVVNVIIFINNFLLAEHVEQEYHRIFCGKLSSEIGDF
jgi:hypothetical protein